MIHLVNPPRYTHAPTDAARDPNDARSALFEIAGVLKTLELQQWSWTLTNWLGLYDGFEQYVPAEIDPMLVVSRVFKRFMREPSNSKIIASDIASALIDLPFMYWHAQWVDSQGQPVGTFWRPLVEPGMPFWGYLSDKPAGAVQLVVERRDDMHLDPQVLLQWLIAGYLRFVLPRRPAPIVEPE